MKSSEKMRAISQQVERSSQEQARGGRQITQAIESISHMVNQLNAAHRQQSRGIEQALAAAARIEEAARRQDAALRELITNAEKLRKAVS